MHPFHLAADVLFLWIFMNLNNLSYRELLHVANKQTTAKNTVISVSTFNKKQFQWDFLFYFYFFKWKCIESNRIFRDTYWTVFCCRDISWKELAHLPHFDIQSYVKWQQQKKSFHHTLSNRADHIQSSLHTTESNWIVSFHFEIEPSLKRFVPHVSKICIGSYFVGRSTTLIHTENKHCYICVLSDSNTCVTTC